MSNGHVHHYRRSVFAPLFLVAIGVLFLLRNWGFMYYRSIGWWFAKYWPVLLILMGIVRLAEYSWARRHNQPVPAFGGGFLVFILICGIAATAISHVPWRDFVDIDDEDWHGWMPDHEFRADISQALEAGSQVKVLSTRGNVSITASPDAQAHLVLHKHIYTYSQEEANHENDSTQLRFEKQGGAWVLDMTGGQYRDSRVDLDLQLPRSLPVYVEARSGFIHVMQHDSDVDLEAEHGEIVIEDIKGNANLRVRHGRNLLVKNILGNVTADGEMHDCTIRDVTGTLGLHGMFYGDVDLTHIEKPVHITTGAGTDIQFSNLDGNLTLDPRNLRGSSIVGPLQVRVQSKYIRLEDITGNADITAQSGNILVSTKAPLGNLTVTTGRGEITLKVPEKAAFQMDAETDYGDITNDFSLNINNTRNSASVSGAVGKDGPPIRLRTNRGTIEIRKQP